MKRPAPPTPPDWQGIAVALDQLREVLRAMVAGLVDDGFTPEQARELVVAATRPRP